MSSFSRAVGELQEEALSGPVTDPRAHDLRQRYLEVFGGPEFPVPVTSIAEDLLGLRVEERADVECSGILLPSERRVLVRADEPEQRKRFTVAHELGHWVCQCMEGKVAPVYCRAQDVTLEPSAKALEREANVFAAELLMPEEAVREAFAAEPLPAPAFGVSDEAMGWRLYSFGLVRSRP